MWNNQVHITRKQNRVLSIIYHYNFRFVEREKREEYMKHIQINGGDVVWFGEVE